MRGGGSDIDQIRKEEGVSEARGEVDSTLENDIGQKIKQLRDQHADDIEALITALKHLRIKKGLKSYPIPPDSYRTFFSKDKLKEIIERAKNDPDKDGWDNFFVNIIRATDLDDDSFFMDIFEQVEGYYIKYEAARKIKDEVLLKKIYEYERENMDKYGTLNGFGALAVSRIEDQDYLTRIALDEGANNFSRVRALSKLNNRRILEKFANITDAEADQLYRKGRFRETARNRLAEMKGTKKDDNFIKS